MERWFNPDVVNVPHDEADYYRNRNPGLVDALERRRKNMNADREFELERQKVNSQGALESRKADLYGQQINAQVKSGQRADREADRRFQIEEAKRRGDVSRGISKALGAGRPGEAQVIAGSSQFAGPNGDLQGVRLDREPNSVTRPAPVVEPKAPEFVGPLEDPEDARARALFAGLGGGSRPAPSGTEPPPFQAPPTEEQGAAALAAGDEAARFSTDQQAARDQYGSSMRSFPGQKIEADRQEQRYQDAEKNPQYRVTYPSGQSDTVDPREARAAAASDAADRANDLERAAAAPGQDPQVSAVMMRQAQLIRAQVSNADKAPITNMGAAVQSQGFKASESAQERQVKREAIRAKGLHKGLTGGYAPGSKEYLREEGELSKELSDYEGRQQNITGPKGLAENQRHLTDAYAAANQENQNPVKQLQILDQLIKSATGLGVRQQMLDTYMQHMGGLIDQGEGKAQAYLNGQVGQAQWQNVKDAIRQSLAESQAQGGAANQRFHGTYDQSEAARRHPDLVKRAESRMFSGLHGYGGQSPPPGTPAQAAPAAPAGETKKLTMPDGSVQEFDAATGKRVK